MRVGKPTLAQFSRRLTCGNNRQRALQFSLGHLIEMIPVKMRQNNEIQWRQIADVHRRIGEAGAVHTVTDRDLLVNMNESRIGQDRKTAVTDQDGRVTNEENRSPSQL